MKTCSKCKISKPLAEFHKAGNGKLYSSCKECHNAWHRNKYRMNDEFRIKSIENAKARNMRRYQNDPEYKAYCNKQSKKFYHNRVAKNPDYNKKRAEANRQRYAEMDPDAKREMLQGKYESKKKRIQDDPHFAFRCKIRARVANCIRKHGYKKTSPTMRMLGCDWKTLQFHLEQGGLKLSDSNISIDHIIPVILALNEEEIMALNHYTNLQLLSTNDNSVKNDNLPDRSEIPDDINPAALAIYERAVSGGLF